MLELYQEAKRAMLTAARQEAGWRWVVLAVVVAAIGLFQHLIGFRLVGAHADFWRAPHNDMATMLAGQEAVFRHGWRFPLVATDRLLSPTLLSTVYTDSIPWMTVALKATGLWHALNGLGLFFLISYALQPVAMYPTHFGRIEGLARLAADLHVQIDAMVALALEVAAAPDRHARLVDGLAELYAARARAHGWTQGRAALEQLLQMDIELNAQGLEVWLGQRTAR